jgi:hypothetical protein
MLTWEEIALQNKQMTMYNYLRFLRESGVIQGLLNIEAIDDIVQKIIPASSGFELQFYGQDKMVSKIYQKITQGK